MVTSLSAYVPQQVYKRKVVAIEEDNYLIKEYRNICNFIFLLLLLAF